MSKSKTVRVVLDQPHTHAHVDYPAGAELDVRPDQAERLENNRIAHRKQQPKSSEVTGDE